MTAVATRSTRSRLWWWSPHFLERYGVSLAAGRAVGEVAHGIDGLVGRPRGHEDAPSRERTGRRAPGHGPSGKETEPAGSLALGTGDAARLRDAGRPVVTATEHAEVVIWESDLEVRR